MAYGDIILSTIGYTSTDSSSTRKNYPIKKLYKQIDNSNSPSFPSSYQEYSSTTYWMPYLNIAISDQNYIEYTDGDEVGWSDNDDERAAEIPSSLPKTNKYDNYPVNHRIIYGNDIYQATSYYFEWLSTGFASNRNPYKQSRIRKWKRLSDTSEVWTQYWYHPLRKRFFVLEDKDILQELPNFDEPDQSRWDMFVGDAADMNLQNFSFAQIKEMISRGISQQSAEATVRSIDNTVMATYGQQSTLPGRVSAQRAASVNRAVQMDSGSPGTPSTSFSVAMESYAATVQSQASNADLPRMIQRRIGPTAGTRLVTKEYTFNLRPNNVSYSNIGVTWTDIERVNNHPLVDYKNNKLMKISFEFVVEEHSGDKSSLYESCEQRLNQLKDIANRPELVIFTNFDSLFGQAADVLDSSYREWAIVEMSISSVQRVPRGISSTEMGAISRATVNMTIQEVRLSNDQVIFMPALTKTPVKPPRRCTRNCGDTPLCVRYVLDDAQSDKTPDSACAKLWKVTTQ